MGRVIAASALSRARVISGRRYWSQWDRHCQDRSRLRGDGRVAAKEVNVDFSRYTPDNYLLSWFTAVAGVELEKDGHTIKSAHNHFINDNGNAWSNQVLLESYHSFIMAENFVEHVSIPEFSKGKVLDAVAWIIEKQFNGYREPIPTVFIDVLIATSKKRHPLLVKKVINGVLNNVSMGCLLPDGYVTMADGTQREIQDILEGDFVLNEHGGAGEVLEVHVREVEDEDIYVGNIVGITDKFALTGEHPVKFAHGLRVDIEMGEKSDLVLPHICGGPATNSTFFAVGTQGEHRNRTCGSNKLYVTETFPREVWLPSEMVTEEFAELLGMLAGDGYFCGVNGYETRLISNLQEVEIDDRAHYLMESCFGHYITFGHQECEITDWFQASNETVTNLFKKFLLGRVASEKKFAPEVIYWPHHLQKALLRGYFNADGDFSKVEILKAESRSKDLRDQIYLMLLRNGVIVNRCRLLHKPTGYSQGGDSYYMYIVYVARGYAEEWMSDKVEVFDSSLGRNSPTFFAQSFAMRKVRSFKKIKYTGKVYNLTVRDAHTYAHCGVVVHNCDILWSVCSRCGKEIEEGYDEQCDHIKNQLGKYYVDKNGVKRRVAELCGRPGVKDSCQFKEVSLVSRPAFLWARMHGFLEYSDISSGRPLRAIVPVSRYKESNREV